MGHNSTQVGQNSVYLILVQEIQLSGDMSNNTAATSCSHRFRVKTGNDKTGTDRNGNDRNGNVQNWRNSLEGNVTAIFQNKTNPNP